MKHNVLGFDVLHNFISPVTGRVLATTNYVLVGDRQGIATPSPILIDIRLDLINLRKRYDALSDADFVIGHPNDQLPNAQVLFDLVDGFLYNTAGVVSTTPTIPISGLPDLTYQNVWTGDITNRPIEVQRLVFNNLPSFISPNPLLNFGIYNLYTGGIDYLDPLAGLVPVPTLAIDMSNLPDLPVGYIWEGQAVSPFPPIFIDDVFPYIHGQLNWGTNRPVASNSLIILKEQVAALEADVVEIQGEITAIQTEISLIQGQIIAIDADLLLINTTLFTPVTGLVSVVAGLVIAVGINTANIATLFARTLDQVPVAVANVNINNNRLTNVSDPINPLDAVNLETLETYIGGAGTVTNVSGTVGQIDVVNNTTTPVISIDPAYVGQTSITTLGTVTSGTWNASTVTVPHGGTGDTSFTAYTLIAGGTTSTGALQSLTAGTSGQVLTSNGSSSLPTWTTPTSGTVTSVTGTVGQIDVANTTTTPVISIDAAYVGQTSITTLGTVTSGTWNASTLTVPYGGTGDTSFTAYAVLAGGTTSTGNLQSLTTGTLGQVLTSQGSSSLPIWTTLSSSGVTSITGTADQITASAPTGAVTLSMPSDVVISNSVTAGNLEMITNTLQSNNANGNIIAAPNGTGAFVVGSSGGGTIYGTLPRGIMYMSSGPVSTSLTSNVWAKVNGTTTSAELNQFSMPTNNKLQYTGSFNIEARIEVQFMATVGGFSGGTGSNFSVYKNGSIVPQSLIGSLPWGSTPPIGMSITTFVSMSTNDYIEFYTMRSGSNAALALYCLIVTISTT